MMWAVEVVLQPGNLFKRIEILIAPGGREIVLPKIDQPRLARSFVTFP
jgi:hypothetical protein